jgi:hypothetical protein
MSLPSRMTMILNLLKTVDHGFNLNFSPHFGPHCGHESHYPVHKGSPRHPLSGVGPASRLCALYLGIAIEPPAVSCFIDPMEPFPLTRQRYQDLAATNVFPTLEPGEKHWFLRYLLKVENSY